MRLLIYTQKISFDDEVLGFMHRWVEEFGKKCESVSVICLEKGTVRLPASISVFSLGKESGRSRLKYVINFYRLLRNQRGNYDAVFVHMNPEYLALGGLYWRLKRVKTALWYNHKKGGFRARLGILLADKVFYTSPFAYAARFKKAQRMPAGIDTDMFKRDTKKERMPQSILSLGRISPVKQLEVLIDALSLLKAEGMQFGARFYGDPTERDRSYFTRLKEKAKALVDAKALRWLPGIPNVRAAGIFNEHELFVSATPSGSFDKAVLEAMACEVPVLSCNPSFRSLVPDECLYAEGDSRDLAAKIKRFFSKSQEEREALGTELRAAVVRDQSLALLVPRVLSALAA